MEERTLNVIYIANKIIFQSIYMKKPSILIINLFAKKGTKTFNDFLLYLIIECIYNDK
jgi:hypothetical protein